MLASWRGSTMARLKWIHVVIFMFLLLLLAIDVSDQSLRMAKVIDERANLRETPSSSGEVNRK